MATYEIEIREVEEQDVATIRGKVPREEVVSWLSATLGTLAAHLQTIGVEIVANPFARYTSRDGEVLELEAGFPVAETVTSRDEVEADTLPAGTVATTWHEGGFDDVQAAYDALDEWLARTGVEAVDRPWEIYHSDPEQAPEADSWIIELVQPYTE